MRKFYKIDQRLWVEKPDDVMDEPRIVRVNSFNEEDLEDFEKDMEAAHLTGQPVIPVVIDSYGGSAYGVLGMIATIEAARVPVATILTTKAMSAGAILFMFGTEGYRYMHAEAGMMIHDIGSWVGGKVEEIKADAKNLDLMNRAVYKRASKAIGKEPDYLSNLIKNQHNHVDWFLTAKDAKSHNIVNHLKVPSFEIEISLNIKFG
jgi:ATP-dependent Clp protease, protease subunit